MSREATSFDAIVGNISIDITNNNKRWVTVQIPSAMQAQMVMPAVGQASPREPSAYLNFPADHLPGVQVGDHVQIAIYLK